MMIRSLMIGSLAVLAACGHQSANARTTSLILAGRNITLPATTTSDGSSRAAAFSGTPRITRQAAMPVAPTAP
jgi:hypothetical protein